MSDFRLSLGNSCYVDDKLVRERAQLGQVVYIGQDTVHGKYKLQILTDAPNRRDSKYESHWQRFGLLQRRHERN